MAVKENLFLCLLISNLAGIFTILGKVVVVVHMKVEREKGQNDNDMIGAQAQQSCSFQNTRTPSTDDESISLASTSISNHGLGHNGPSWPRWKTMTGFIVANILANLCIFFSPWFGPVSIYWPTFVASQLLANMIILGILFKHENFMKKDQVATLVVVAAVLYINLTGPGSNHSRLEPSPDIRELLSENIFAWIWLSAVSLIFLISFGGMLRLPIVDCSWCQSPGCVETVLMSVSITCSTLSATASKAASTLDKEDDRVLRIILMAISWLVIFCWSVENYMEGAHVRSLARFLPGVTMGSILMNAITGVLVWKDYKEVDSWVGYATALVLLGMGVYLISNVDFFPCMASGVSAEELPLQSPYPEGGHDRSHVGLLAHLGRLQQDLSRAQLELILPRHQQALLRHRRRLVAIEESPNRPKISSSSLAYLSSDKEREMLEDSIKDKDKADALPLTDLRRGLSDPEWGMQGTFSFKSNGRATESVGESDPFALLFPPHPGHPLASALGFSPIHYNFPSQAYHKNDFHIRPTSHHSKTVMPLLKNSNSTNRESSSGSMPPKLLLEKPNHVATNAINSVDLWLGKHSDEISQPSKLTDWHAKRSSASAPYFSPGVTRNSSSVQRVHTISPPIRKESKEFPRCSKPQSFFSDAPTNRTVSSFVSLWDEEEDNSPPLQAAISNDMEGSRSNYSSDTTVFYDC